MRSISAAKNLKLAAVALGLCLSATPASAENPPKGQSERPVQTQPAPLGEALQGRALAEYNGGKLLFVNRDFPNALIKFQQAYELSHDPRLLWNVAICYKEMRRYTRMLATLRKLLAEGGTLLTEQDRSDAANAAKAVEAFVSLLKLRVNETGAAVVIDGETMGTTPLAEQPLLDVGSHEIRISKPGFKDVIKSVVAAGASDVVVDVRLEKDLHEGRLVVQAGAKDAIQLDGKAVGQNRWEGRVTSGGHTLRVTAPGMQPYQSDVLVKDNEVRHVDVTLTPLAGKDLSRWLWIAGGGVLFAGAVIGGVLLFQPTNTTVDGTINPPGKIRLTFGGE